jgi:hypothetical protein
MGQLKFVAVNILFLRVVRVLLQANRTPALVHTLISRTADPEIKEEVNVETDQIPA